MKRIILLTLLIPVLAHAQRYGHTSGSTFYWNKSGEAQKSDSIRYIQGSNITLTQSGNTLTIAGAAGAGSTANVRANTGWTAQGGATATDTVVTYLLWNGKYQRAMFVDTDNDSVIIAPHDLYLLVAKDGTTILAAIDSSGNIYSGSPTGTSVALSPTSANNPTIYFREATDFANDYFTIQYEGAENRLKFNGNENDAGDAYFQFLDDVDIGGAAGDPTARLVLSDGSSGAALMRAANNTSGTTATDGTVFGIDASEATIIWNYENSAMSFATNNTARMTIAAAGGVGIGATTEAQANRAKFNVLGRASADTLIGWSNEGSTSLTGDSAIYVLPNGAMSIASTTSYSGLGSGTRLNVGGDVRMEGNSLIITGATAQIQLNSSLQRIFYDATNKMQFYANGAAAHVMDDNGYVGINNSGLKSRNQAVLTVRGRATADTTFMVRNNNGSGTDSTVFFTATGDIDAGGNNLYLGGHRIRSNAAGDSLIFYDGTTMVFAILSDGSTADLVAGTPPIFWRNLPPQEYIWLLRLGVLLLLLLVAFKVHDYLKPFIRKHKTLPGEI